MGACKLFFHESFFLASIHQHPHSKRMQFIFLLFACAVSFAASATPYVQKLENVVIYKDDKFYSTFPSVVCRPNGELIVAFRRAPERRPFGESRITHTDANSYLMDVRSTDHGRHWSPRPEL